MPICTFANYEFGEVNTFFLVSYIFGDQEAQKSKNQIEFCTIADTRSWHGDTKSPACTLNLVGELSCPLWWLELTCPRGWKNEKLFFRNVKLCSTRGWKHEKLF